MPAIPISDQEQEKIILCTNEYISRAAEMFDIELKFIPVYFGLRGLKAGMYRRDRRGRSIHYNPHFFAEFMDDSLHSTVPHEVAHYVTDMLYGLSSIRPHGLEWKAVMNAFGAKPSRTCNYDLSTIPHRRENRHHYRCDCTQYQLSTRRHNKIQNNLNFYLCKSCKQRLIYQGPVE